MNFIQVPDRDGLCHKRSNAFIERAINNQIGPLTFCPTLVLKRRPFAKNGRRIEINMMARTGHWCFATGGWSSVNCCVERSDDRQAVCVGAVHHCQRFPILVDCFWSIYDSSLRRKLSYGEAQEKDPKHPASAIGGTIYVDYFARKSEQARELMRKLGRDREKLNEAASKVSRR
jgi:hypothetical protein